MTNSFGSALLWLFVINLGIACGAGLYEHRIVVPRWIDTSATPRAHWNAEAARHDDTGRRFWVFVTTVPLTLLTIANLFAGWQASGPLRAWCLAAAVAGVADRAFTFSYFIPTMVRLMSAGDSVEAVATAIQWSNLNYLRLAIGAAAWLAALRAFALFHRQSNPF
jgi:hypothetical protein